MKPFKFSRALFVFLIPMLLIAASAPSQAAAPAKKEYVFGMHFGNLGFGAAQILDLAEKAMAIVEKDTGTSWTLKKYPSAESALDAFMKGESHATFFWPNNIDVFIKSKVKYYPWAGYTTANQEKAGECIWHAKGMKINSAKDLVGKSLVQSYYSPIVTLKLREYLADNGVDQPLWNVFSSFMLVNNTITGFMAVSMGKVDVTWRPDEYKYFWKMINPTLGSRLTASLCTKPIYERGMLVLNADKVSPKEFKFYSDSLKQLLIDLPEMAKKDPANRSAVQMLQQAKMQLVAIEPPAFKAETALYEKAKKKGWLKEAEYINKVMSAAEPGKPVVIKPPK